jgi:Holliday junction resolvase RusA-like endonuclease
MRERLFECRAHGIPVPQGSMKGFKTKSGKVILTSANDKMKPWRALVISAAVEANLGKLPIAEPVAVEVIYYLPRPKTAPKRVIFPAKKPDKDKLDRAIYDALTQAGVWVDDALNIASYTEKKFATPDNPPGAEITIWRMQDDDPQGNPTDLRSSAVHGGQR